MAFEKGISGNPNGRKPGTRNKATINLRDAVQNLLTDNYVQIFADLKDLEPRDRITAYIKLLDFALPKLQRTEVKTDIGSLTDTQVDTIVNKILDNEKTVLITND